MGGSRQPRPPLLVSPAAPSGAGPAAQPSPSQRRRHGVSLRPLFRTSTQSRRPRHPLPRRRRRRRPPRRRWPAASPRCAAAVSLRQPRLPALQPPQPRTRPASPAPPLARVSARGLAGPGTTGSTSPSPPRPPASFPQHQSAAPVQQRLALPRSFPPRTAAPLLRKVERSRPARASGPSVGAQPANRRPADFRVSRAERGEPDRPPGTAGGGAARSAARGMIRVRVGAGSWR